MDEMFKDGVCPFLFTDAAKKYNLSDKFIESFCNKGCSPICGRELKEYLNKKGLLQIEGQMNIEDYPEVMPGGEQ